MRQIKTYEAPNTIISNITMMVGGKPRRVSFDPISEYEGKRTGHGSRLTTDDERLQNAIERSNLYGSVIFCYKVETLEDYNLQSGTEGTEQEQEGAMIKVVKVESPNDAKEYLAKEFGMNTRVLYDVKRIQNAAAKVGVRFEGL